MDGRDFNWKFLYERFGDLNDYKTIVHTADKRYMRRNYMATLTFMVSELMDAKPDDGIRFIINLFHDRKKLRYSMKKVYAIFKDLLKEGQGVMSDETERDLYSAVFLGYDEFLDQEINCSNSNLTDEIEEEEEEEEEIQ
ncbi:uncharacterized protein LOC119662462 isoform X2 [Teleopsis dalmanni]|uniref:uncharacterized protein LOC119662462 isoform X2 n=1 Tax=Teleopsis dalmanni TaxID=139649 RepID=UPI0018CF75A7|nr:uncharacterized protein LOC119662462 isoform X2 [Teleopsis dalmanni]